MRLLATSLVAGVAYFVDVSCAIKTGHVVQTRDEPVPEDTPAPAEQDVEKKDEEKIDREKLEQEIESIGKEVDKLKTDIEARRATLRNEGLSQGKINDDPDLIAWSSSLRERKAAKTKAIDKRKPHIKFTPPPRANCTHSLLTKNNGGPVRVVVSIATTGTEERLEHLKRTIDSLWNQTLKPHRIVLSFPKEFKRKHLKIQVPQFVKEWEREIPALTIQQIEDYGPASKLLGGLLVEKDPETIIVVGDDDVQYRNYTVERLVCELLDPPVPEEVATCFAGEMPCHPYAGHSRWRPAERFFGYGRGVGGVAYRVRYFDEFVWKINDPATPKGCFVNDDVWIGGAMKKATGTLPYIVRGWGNSVIRHGSCDGLGCGFEQNSSSVANDHYKKETGMDMKEECEAYFDNFCCPEMCVGGRYQKPGHGFKPGPGTLWYEGTNDKEASQAPTDPVLNHKVPRSLAKRVDEDEQ